MRVDRKSPCVGGGASGSSGRGREGGGEDKNPYLDIERVIHVYNAISACTSIHSMKTPLRVLRNGPLLPRAREDFLFAVTSKKNLLYVLQHLVQGSRF